MTQMDFLVVLLCSILFFLLMHICVLFEAILSLPITLLRSIQLSYKPWTCLGSTNRLSFRSFRVTLIQLHQHRIVLIIRFSLFTTDKSLEISKLKIFVVTKMCCNVCNKSLDFWLELQVLGALAVILFGFWLRTTRIFEIQPWHLLCFSGNCYKAHFSLSLSSLIFVVLFSLSTFFSWFFKSRFCFTASVSPLISSS